MMKQDVAFVLSEVRDINFSNGECTTTYVFDLLGGSLEWLIPFIKKHGLDDFYVLPSNDQLSDLDWIRTLSFTTETPYALMLVDVCKKEQIGIFKFEDIKFDKVLDIDHVLNRFSYSDKFCKFYNEFITQNKLDDSVIESDLYRYFNRYQPIDAGFGGCRGYTYVYPGDVSESLKNRRAAKDYAVGKMIEEMTASYNMEVKEIDISDLNHQMTIE